MFSSDRLDDAAGVSWAGASSTSGQDRETPLRAGCGPCVFWQHCRICRLVHTAGVGNQDSSRETTHKALLIVYEMRFVSIVVGYFCWLCTLFNVVRLLA